MPSYIAWLRAVNVGGRVIKMAALRDYLTEAGFVEPETYIQSGNVRFTTSLRSAAKVEAAVESALEARCGFLVKTLVRTPAELAALVTGSPPSPLGPDARHYMAFLRAIPGAEAAAALNGWNAPGERMALVGRDLHLWLTKPTSEATINNARIEKLAGIDATTRDWKVVTAVAQLWGQSAPRRKAGR